MFYLPWSFYGMISPHEQTFIIYQTQLGKIVPVIPWNCGLVRGGKSWNLRDNADRTKYKVVAAKNSNTAQDHKQNHCE